ncbi:MAG: DNA repair protein RadC [Desulfosporosinus sp.]|nr:DNA repair protein RadC [Desulfosporosinus sp.]
MYNNLPLQDLLALTVRESSTDLLKKFPSITELAEATEEELIKVKGLGKSKAMKILVALELGRRMYTASAKDIVSINSPQDVYDLLIDMTLLDREYFKAIFLNTKNHVIAVETISIGTLNSSLVHPREVFKGAIKRSACSVIPVHNHPSGDPTPSTEDLEITKRLVDAGKLLGILVVDHVIIGSQRYISLKERGVM